MAFGPWSQTLLAESTRQTIRLIGQIDGPLSEGILLTHFAQPQAGPCWTAQSAVLLHDEGLCSEAPGGSSEGCSPLPRAIFFRWGPSATKTGAHGLRNEFYLNSNLA